MKKPKKSKTTEAFKEQMLHLTIIPALNFKGMRMLFPYRWNGEEKMAQIDLSSVIKSIKWDIKRI